MSCLWVIGSKLPDYTLFFYIKSVEPKSCLTKTRFLFYFRRQNYYFFLIYASKTIFFRDFIEIVYSFFCVF